MSFQVSALVLAGGSGTRFWPASRRLRPKQLLALEGERSLLQGTVDRLQPLVPSERVWISTTAALRDAIAEQLPEVPASQILTEPSARNTAPAIGWSLLNMPEQVRSGALLVLPSDHRIADPVAFRAALALAAGVVEREAKILTLGVVPSHPETGFGYLEMAEALPGASGLRRVQRFTEKPDRANAERFVAGGQHLWNAGIFVFRGDVLLAALERHSPELWLGLAELARNPEKVDELYPQLHSISIDYAVMEKFAAMAALPLDCGWSDLGSWDALAGVLPADDDGNVARGGSVVVDGARNITFAEEGTIAILGLSDLIVVRSGDAVLVARRQDAQEVRRIVERLAASGRSELL
ncbi:MAG: sugar phosphate nucleotidyltransferase [Thermoanaerobaculia bacterium]